MSLRDILRWLIRHRPTPPPAPKSWQLSLTVEPHEAEVSVESAGLLAYFRLVNEHGFQVTELTSPPWPQHGQGTLKFRADGYLPKIIPNQPLGASNMDLGLFQLQRQYAQLPRLVPSGTFWRKENGDRISICECSDFNLCGKLVEEGFAVLRRVLQQRADLGFNSVRIFTEYDIPGIGRFRREEVRDLYALIGRVADEAANYGLYVNAVAYTGINDPTHWQALGEVAKARTNMRLSLVNELDANTDEPDHLGRVFDLSLHSKIDGVLCSHGSNGSDRPPVRPWWDWEEYHSNDAFEWPRKPGHNAMEFSEGSQEVQGSHVPCEATENTRCPDRYNSQKWSYQVARSIALLTAGGCFHSVDGKASELFDGDTLANAISWVAGFEGLDLTCQDGPYRHRQDLEGPDELRDYQRGDRDECIVRISQLG